MPLRLLRRRYAGFFFSRLYSADIFRLDAATLLPHAFMPPLLPL